MGYHTRNNKLVKRIFWICIATSLVMIFCGEYLLRVHPRNEDTNSSNFEKIILLPKETKWQNASRKRFTPCPKEFCKLVWMGKSQSSKLHEPVYRAFHSRGYSRTKDFTRAHFLYTDQPWQSKNFSKILQPWQRYSHLPHTNEWDDKDKMALTMNKYYAENGIPHLHSFVESYVLHLAEGLEAFRNRLSEANGGMGVPWVLKKPKVNQGKGIFILPPHSKELREIIDVVEKATDEGDQERLVVQKYICDEMTYDGRKFDVRIFWVIASLDPLIVFYHTKQNYVRVGHAVYNESSFGNTDSTTKSHLTTHTFGSSETKATWDEFRVLIENHVFGSESKFRQRFVKDKNNLPGTNETIDKIIENPFLHVQNQMKTVIGHLANAFKNITFHTNDIVAENGFTHHAADMIIDNNLDVYVIEGTDGPGKDEDYDFRIRMHRELLGSMVDIVEEVTSRQVKGLPLDVSAMNEKGVLGGYEVVYDNGWFMDYRYQRLPNVGCMINNSNKNPAHGSKSIMMNVAALPTRDVAPATFTSLPKQTNGITKTFWMKSRTTRTSEPVARSLRRNGWTPVDAPEDAQLVYHTQDKYMQYEDKPRLWQYVSQFPSQYTFFDKDKHLKYLDVRKVGGHVCRPLHHNHRPLEVRVYWLVLSLDPLIVLYHDGLLHLTYHKDDENEFMDLDFNPNQEERKAPTWKGSWKVFVHYLNRVHAHIIKSGKSEAAKAAAAISIDPIQHVRNQMKESIANMAEGFAKHTAETWNRKDETYSSFALYCSQFQVDRNLNVFATDSFHSYIKGESFAEIVDFHDELYASAFWLLEHLNNTSANTLSQEREHSSILGNYEWLIRSAAYGNNTKQWKFQYDWDIKAKECFD